MTASQHDHRAEQMDAAREEFNKLWDNERKEFSSLRESAQAQRLAWSLFLHAKGLKK